MGNGHTSSGWERLSCNFSTVIAHNSLSSSQCSLISASVKERTEEIGTEDEALIASTTSLGESRSQDPLSRSVGTNCDIAREPVGIAIGATSWWSRRRPSCMSLELLLSISCLTISMVSLTASHESSVAARHVPTPGFRSWTRTREPFLNLPASVSRESAHIMHFQTAPWRASRLFLLDECRRTSRMNLRAFELANSFESQMRTRAARVMSDQQARFEKPSARAIVREEANVDSSWDGFRPPCWFRITTNVFDSRRTELSFSFSSAIMVLANPQSAKAASTDEEARASTITGKRELRGSKKKSGLVTTKSRTA